MANVKNRIFIAAAGAGKTTRLIEEAISRPDSRILMTTYTEENEGEIRKKFIQMNGCIPKNVTLMGWFSFLLEHCVRPYQGYKTASRVAGLHFNQGISAPYSNEHELRHYFDAEGQIYRDKVSKFACKCDELSEGRVLRRLSEIFDEIFVDEIQDVSGYDLDLIELLMDSPVQFLLVGDPRQGTYSTSDSPKYGKFKKAGILHYFKQITAARQDVLLDETTLAINHRCKVQLCALSGALFPDFPQSESSNTTVTEHDGVFLVRKSDVAAYLRYFAPVQLRYSRRTDTSTETPTINFGKSKGLTFERVLMYPTKDFVTWLEKRETFLSEDVRAKSYVALTRARHSVGIVVTDNTQIAGFAVWNAQ